MSPISDTAKNMFAGFGLIVFLLIAAFFIIAMWRAPIHQFNLWTLGRNFKAVDSHHPENSKFVLKVKDFGNLFRAASNGCDYLVGEFRIGQGSKGEIMRRYQGLVIKSFDSLEPIPIEFHFLDDDDFFKEESLWFEWRENVRASFDLYAARGNPYIVFAEQTDYPPYGDFRCFYETPIH